MRTPAAIALSVRQGDYEIDRSAQQGKASNMNRWKFWGDESGGEVLEYALIAGLFIVCALAVIGSKVFGW
jgi:hypothetical protein